MLNEVKKKERKKEVKKKKEKIHLCNLSRLGISTARGNRVGDISAGWRGEWGV